MATSDYLNYITSEHRDKPKFIATLSIWLDYCNDVETLINAINLAFDIDYAVGNQLDIIGQRIGASRTVTLSTLSVVLDDDDYRILLKAQIFKNTWRGSTSTIYSDWENIFPDNPLIIKDNQNMTMDVITIGFSNGNQAKLVSNGYIVPKPQGVGVNYSSANLPIFGYGLDTSTVAGYDTGQWLTFST